MVINTTVKAIDNKSARIDLFHVSNSILCNCVMVSGKTNGDHCNQHALLTECIVRGLVYHKSNSGIQLAQSIRSV